MRQEVIETVIRTTILMDSEEIQEIQHDASVFSGEFGYEIGPMALAKIIEVACLATIETVKAEMQNKFSEAKKAAEMEAEEV